MTEAYVTLVATDSYAAGALVLGHKLLDLSTKKETVCLITPNISSRVRDILSQVFSQVIQVDTIRSIDFDNLELLGRPELDITFTKIHLWRLTQYTKVVFLDADTYPLRNIDELFERTTFSAAPDAGWPDCFNSGVFVTEPSESIFEDLKELASEKGSFDGGDQGLLNTYFSSWSSNAEGRLPFTFNTTPTSQYGYAPAHNQYGHNISILHFIGENKPWKYQRFSDGKVLPLGGAWEGLRDMVQEWWNTWDLHYGRTPPYHLLSGDFDHHQFEFDSGFQTRPIVPFDEEVENAWDMENIHYNEERRRIQPMPPVSKITFRYPEWVKDEKSYQEQEKHEPTAYHETQSQQEVPPQYEEQHHHEEQPYFDKNHDNQHHEEHYACEQHHDNHTKGENTYSMIEWDPAHQGPPKTGRLGADIPDLSYFQNVWDKSNIEQQQRIWVAPAHQPEPQIMAKPEYSHYNTQDYDSEILYPQEQHQQPEYKEEVYKEYYHHHEEPAYPPTFPWDSNPGHFPPPTRVWLDEEQVYHHYYNEESSHQHQHHEEFYHQAEEHHHYHHEDVHENHHSDTDNLNIVIDHHEQQQGHYVEEKIESHGATSELETIISQAAAPEPPLPLFAIDQPMTPSAQNKIDQFIATLAADDKDSHDISDRDLIPIKFKSSSRLQSGMYSPSPTGSRTNSRRASVTHSRRNSVSAAIVAAAAAAGMTPSVEIPVYNTPQEVEQSSRLFAGEPSTFSRKTPYTSAAATPAATFGSPSSEYNENDTYFIPTTSEPEALERSISHEERTASPYKPADFLEPAQYSLEESLELEREPEIEWDPVKALNKLKEHSESMVLRQSLQEALVRTAKEQEKESERLEYDDDTTNVVNKKKKLAFRSSWDDEEYDLPSGLASGQSSPRTPIVRSTLDSNLSREIELEKERHKQQGASLMLAQPQAAVASMLEAELDLSQGTLFKRRHHYEDSEEGSESVVSSHKTLSEELFASGGEGETTEQQQTHTAFFDYDVVKEAQRKLRALVTGEEIEQEHVKFGSIPIPLSREEKHVASTTVVVEKENVSTQQREEDSQAFGLKYSIKSYRLNFGFDQHNKLSIYKSDLAIPDALEEIAPLDKAIEIKESPITRGARLTKELAKEQEERETKKKEANEKEVEEEASVIGVAAAVAAAKIAAVTLSVEKEGSTTKPEVPSPLDKSEISESVVSTTSSAPPVVHKITTAPATSVSVTKEEGSRVEGESDYVAKKIITTVIGTAADKALSLKPDEASVSPSKKVITTSISKEISSVTSTEERSSIIEGDSYTENTTTTPITMEIPIITTSTVREGSHNVSGQVSRTTITTSVSKEIPIASVVTAQENRSIEDEASDSASTKKTIVTSASKDISIIDVDATKDNTFIEGEEVFGSSIKKVITTSASKAIPITSVTSTEESSSVVEDEVESSSRKIVTISITKEIPATSTSTQEESLDVSGQVSEKIITTFVSKEIPATSVITAQTSHLSEDDSASKKTVITSVSKGSLITDEVTTKDSTLSEGLISSSIIKKIITTSVSKEISDTLSGSTQEISIGEDEVSGSTIKKIITAFIPKKLPVTTSSSIQEIPITEGEHASELVSESTIASTLITTIVGEETSTAATYEEIVSLSDSEEICPSHFATEYISVVDDEMDDVEAPSWVVEDIETVSISVSEDTSDNHQSIEYITIEEVEGQDITSPEEGIELVSGSVSFEEEAFEDHYETEYIIIEEDEEEQVVSEEEESDSVTVTKDSFAVEDASPREIITTYVTAKHSDDGKKNITYRTESSSSGSVVSREATGVKSGSSVANVEITEGTSISQPMITETIIITEDDLPIDESTQAATLIKEHSAKDSQEVTSVTRTTIITKELPTQQASASKLSESKVTQRVSTIVKDLPVVVQKEAPTALVVKAQSGISTTVKTKAAAEPPNLKKPMSHKKSNSHASKDSSAEESAGTTSASSKHVSSHHVSEDVVFTPSAETVEIITKTVPASFTTARSSDTIMTTTKESFTASKLGSRPSSDSLKSRASTDSLKSRASSTDSLKSRSSTDSLKKKSSVESVSKRTSAADLKKRSITASLTGKTTTSSASQVSSGTHSNKKTSPTSSSVSSHKSLHKKPPATSHTKATATDSHAHRSVPGLSSGHYANDTVQGHSQPKNKAAAGSQDATLHDTTVSSSKTSRATPAPSTLNKTSKMASSTKSTTRPSTSPQVTSPTKPTFSSRDAASPTKATFASRSTLSSANVGPPAKLASSPSKAESSTNVASKTSSSRPTTLVKSSQHQSKSNISPTKAEFSSKVVAPPAKSTINKSALHSKPTSSTSKTSTPHAIVSITKSAAASPVTSATTSAILSSPASTEVLSDTRSGQSITGRKDSNKGKGKKEIYPTASVISQAIASPPETYITTASYSSDSHNHDGRHSSDQHSVASATEITVLHKDSYADVAAVHTHEAGSDSSHQHAHIIGTEPTQHHHYHITSSTTSSTQDDKKDKHQTPHIVTTTTTTTMATVTPTVSISRRPTERLLSPKASTSTTFSVANETASFTTSPSPRASFSFTKQATGSSFTSLISATSSTSSSTSQQKDDAKKSTGSSTRSIFSSFSPISLLKSPSSSTSKKEKKESKK